ncbi:MAG: patatin-like phospholipase family protein [Candidatus Zixiibacteriota bacterium]
MQVDTGRTERELSIGIALSGGGVRAAAFHLGVLGFLAQMGLLGGVRFISSVSGGSLAIGLVMAATRNAWPTDEQYLHVVLPVAIRRLQHDGLAFRLLLEGLKRPWDLFNNRANLLASALQQSWKIAGNIADLPPTPQWFINTTAYESGKSWRIMQERMGGYQLEYCWNPRIPLASALAASAAYPGLVGPLVFRTKDHEWRRFTGWENRATEDCKPTYRTLHLWDGGVYDNLGLEALFKPSGESLRKGCNFLLVSDASYPLSSERPTFLHRRALRLLEISMDQVRSLRSRMAVAYFSSNPNSGVYLRTGNTAGAICGACKCEDDRILAAAATCMPTDAVDCVAHYPTNLSTLSREDCHTLVRHGWETAAFTLFTRCPELFSIDAYRAYESSLFEIAPAPGR